jgi:hypothetical protein
MAIRIICNAGMISALLGAVASLQAAQEAENVPITRSNFPSGAQLYRQNCAV